MKQIHQLQATAQESIKALEAFESLLRQAIPVVEEYAKVTKDPINEGVRSWVNYAKEALEKWAK